MLAKASWWICPQDSRGLLQDEWVFWTQSDVSPASGQAIELFGIVSF